MIEKLRARGFLGIKRGMDLDEIEIDFTGRSGLIALDGANGRGKTSVLDLLHPFDCLASRDGSLKTHCFLRDSIKELIFTHGGHHYRTLLKIDSESGRSEGFAWIDHSEASIVKGKISEYHKWAVQEFGSPELFFASIFCAQNSKKISDMTVGTLKGLFVEFLRLERYEAWADTSKQAANIIEGKAAQLDNQIFTLTEVTTKKDEVSFALDGYRVKTLPTWEDEKARLQRELTEKRNQIDTLKETIGKNTLSLERKRDLQTQIDKLNADLAKEKETATAEINDLSVKYMEIKGELADKLAFLLERGKIEAAADRQRDLENSLIILQAAIDRLTDEATGEQLKVNEINAAIARLEASRHSLDMDPGTIEAEKELSALNAKLDSAKQALENLKNDKSLLMADGKIIVAKEKMKSLDLKDPACQSSTCDFIVEAIKAKASLPELEAERDRVRDELAVKVSAAETWEEDVSVFVKLAVEKLNGRREDVKARRETVDGEISRANADLKNAQKKATGAGELITANRQQLATARAEIIKQKAFADRLPEVTIAEARKADLEKQLKEVTEQGTAKKLAWQEKEKASEAAMSELRFNIRHIEMQLDEKAETALQGVQWDIKEIETVKLPALDKEIQDTRDKIAALQAELKQIEAAGKELDEVKAKRDTLTVEASRWRYLQNACGKNGLQALEIDGAAPLISSRANELLAMGYGPQYSIRIDTQDEEGREDLDIKVISEYGEDSLKQKSGGEKVWLLHPIRLAMTLLSKEKSGRDWDYTAFDEITGALDSKGAATNFMEMYAPFMKMGGIKQLFFITHQDECLGYADHVLRFEKGIGPQWG